MDTSEPQAIPTTRLGYVRRTLARWFEVTTDSREHTLSVMLERHARDAPGYWLQLLLAMGIATLGLVLDSTGVVIGAMLIAPLMGPIVELGMGLATGSGFLAMRSTVRALGSVVVVVGGALIITASLPIHVVTREIAARTAPTVLDLFVALCCALAAAYAVVRPAVETASTAAGTAIGIALVPPLCVVGYGLGTQQVEVARGGGLLFTVNFSAIILFSVLWFRLLGFDTVPVKELEERLLSNGRGQRRMAGTARRLRDMFGARYGRVLRWVMPLMLVATVYFPLRGALEEMAWQARVRASVARLLSAVPMAQSAVRQVVAVERHSVTLRLIVIASPDAAADLERDLQARVAAVAGVVPTVTVTPVPDFESLRASASAVQLPSPVEAPTTLGFQDATHRLGETLRELWPTREAGVLLAWRIVPRGSGIEVELVHLGPPLGAAAPLLTRALRAATRVSLTAVNVAVARGQDAPAESGPRWLPALSDAVRIARHHNLSVCARRPDDATLALSPRLGAVLEAAVAILSALPEARRAMHADQGWGFTLQEGACPTPEPTPSPDAATAADATAPTDAPSTPAPPHPP